MSTTEPKALTNTTGIPGLLSALTDGNCQPFIDELRARALSGDSVAATALGHIYFSGKHGIPKDYAAARRWLCMANPKYDATGFVAMHLASLYYKGLGVSKDPVKAYGYLCRAALRGNPNGKALLGILTMQGRGCETRPHRAMVLLRSSLADRKVNLFIRFIVLTELVKAKFWSFLGLFGL